MKIDREQMKWWEETGTCCCVNPR